jgi:hypothetical protein
MFVGKYHGTFLLMGATQSSKLCWQGDLLSPYYFAGVLLHTTTSEKTTETFHVYQTAWGKEWFMGGEWMCLLDAFSPASHSRLE